MISHQTTQATNFTSKDRFEISLPPVNLLPILDKGQTIISTFINANDYNPQEMNLIKKYFSQSVNILLQFSEL